MKKRGKITNTERLEIALLRNKGYGVREIGRVLDRSPGSMSDELKRNQTQGGYDPLAANRKARVRRMDAKFQGMKIESDPDLKSYVIRKLEAHWNPDEISGRMRDDGEVFYVSKTAIYDWLRSVYGDTYCRHLASGRHRKRERKPKTVRVMIPERVSIHERFRGAEHRTRYGHWEGDTMVSAKKCASTAAASVISERKSKLIVARRIENLKPSSHTRAIHTMLENKKALSLTQDNGIENTRHGELGIPTFFCDPYSSWQKGGVEHANKMIRRYIPKGTDFAHITQEHLNHIVSIINGKPRKSLGYRTALEVASAAGLFLTTGS